MLMSDSINELAAALAKAQGEIRGAVKDTTNTFFKTKYADLSAVVEAIRKPFADNGLSYIQSTHIVLREQGTEVQVETTILHSSGQWFAAGLLAMPVWKDDPQARMSALTYCRRGSLSAAVGVAPEDDDANSISEREPVKVGMTDKIRNDLISGIKSAEDMKILQTRYGTALKAAQALGDQGAAAAIISAKDARKEALKTPAVPA